MSTISNELVKDLRMAFSVWQQDYDPVEDKAQYDMFGLGIVAMDELLALRKERERAEPDFYVVVTSVGVWQSFHRSRAEAEFIVNKPFNPGYSVLEIYTAPPAPVVADDSLPYDPQIAEYEQMMEAEQAQADTTSQQFESLVGKTVGGWIPCSERMPETYVNVLLTDEHGDTCIGQLESFEDSHFYISSSIHRYKATHWQPLPEPPCK